MTTEEMMDFDKASAINDPDFAKKFDTLMDEAEAARKSTVVANGTVENTLDEAPPANTKEETEAYVKPVEEVPVKPAETVDEPVSAAEKGLREVAQEAGLTIDPKLAGFLKTLSSAVESQAKEAKASKFQLEGVSQAELDATIAPLKNQVHYKDLGLTPEQEKALAVSMYTAEKQKPVDRVVPVARPVQQQVQNTPDFTPSLLDSGYNSFRKVLDAKLDNYKKTKS